MTIIDEIALVLNEAQNADYIGEAITQKEHALQCAYFAKKSGHSDDVVIACLLHDIGHYISDEPAELTEHMDKLGRLEHEYIAAKYLRKWGFSEKIITLVKNHVAAKRYLAAKNPSYYKKLSKASQATLEYQGGPMRKYEKLEFEQSPYFVESIQLRVNDEKAKVKNLSVPCLASYRGLISKYLKK